MKHDDDAAVQVVEAILVAVLVATTLIFFALSQRPNIPSTSPQADLAQVAQDALDLVRTSPGLSCVDTGDCTAIEADIRALLPDGMQFELYRTQAGSAPSPLMLPEVTPGAGAQAGATYHRTSTLYLVELVVWDVF